MLVLCLRFFWWHDITVTRCTLCTLRIRMCARRRRDPWSQWQGCTSRRLKRLRGRVSPLRSVDFLYRASSTLSVPLSFRRFSYREA